MHHCHKDTVDGEDSDNIDPLSEITDLDKAKQLIKDFKKLEKPLNRKKEAFLEIIG